MPPSVHSSVISHCPQTGRRRVAVLGATGSIGTSTLDVIQSLPDRLQVFGLSFHRSVDQLDALIEQHRPAMVACTGEVNPRTQSVGLGPTFVMGSMRR
ncbi:MAG: hypothetical protein QM703_05955 [Gemmatales bacterium]